MTTTITADYGGTTTPVLATDIQTSGEGSNVFHKTLGGGTDVTLIPAGDRSGTLELLYDDEELAYGAYWMHTSGGVYSITDTERSRLAMYYVLSGNVSIELDDQTRDLWKVSVSYQEVPSS